jgi:hypothetical protein
MQTDFSKRQRNILDLVIRMSYGCGKKTAILRPVDFELVGVYKTHVRRELETLQEAGVIFWTVNRITLNKNYDEWKVGQVKGASADRLCAILKRNLDDLKSYQNSNFNDDKEMQKVTKTVTSNEGKVTDMVTFEAKKVTETVTHEKGEVTKTVTLAEGEVTKTVTDQDTQPNDGADSGAPKEILVKDLKEKLVTPLTPLKPKQTIEDILTRFPRYTSGQLTLIRKYWDTIRFTRRTGKIADSIVAREMEYWERFPVEIVLDSLDIHMRKYQSKREDYTSGIMRRMVLERKRGGQPGGKHDISDIEKRIERTKETFGHMLAK